MLAANTAFADFPRLSSLLARDRFLPRQLANRGDRLVFSNGIVILAIFSSVLVVAFGGDTSRLIPLYAIGVFLSFTLSQSGMVIHEEEATASLKDKWERWGAGVQLVVLRSPYRELTRPLLRHINRLAKENSDDIITVVLPEFIPARWWQHFLHNQSSLLLKGSLLFKKGVIVTSVPYHLEH